MGGRYVKPNAYRFYFNLIFLIYFKVKYSNRSRRSERELLFSIHLKHSFSAGQLTKRVLSKLSGEPRNIWITSMVVNKENCIYIYIYIYMCVCVYVCVCVCVCIYFGSISSLIQISLNIIDILCQHIFFWIRSNSRITFIVFGGNWYMYCP